MSGQLGGGQDYSQLISGINKAMGSGGGAQPIPPAAPAAPVNVNNLPRGNYQIPGYNGGGAPAALPQQAAAPARANYSPNNPFGGIWSNPQADQWEQQQRGGGAAMPLQDQPVQRAAVAQPAGLPPQAAAPAVQRAAVAAGAPQPDTMRKNLGYSNINDPNYGYGTPGGYQLETTPNTTDPGSMLGLLGILGGNRWQHQAADYANWYRNTYGQQAPGGPKAYPF
jgi:hypothetical protein